MLDLVRLAEDRWLARAVATRRDGVAVLLEEVLTSREIPKVEAAVTSHDDAAWLVLRDRDDPATVFAEVSLEVPYPRLRLVRSADTTTATPRSTPPAPLPPVPPAPLSPTPTGPPVPA